MTTTIRFAALLVSLAALAACGSTGQEPGSGGSNNTVAGTMTFVLGGTGGVGASALVMAGRDGAAVQPPQVAAGEEYIVSPRKAKITFTSVVFRGSLGETLGTSNFSSCAVTYDRSLASGSSLLDCPFTAPVGDVYQIAVYFDKTLQLLVSDSLVGIHSNPSAPGGYSSAVPAGGASFVPLVITIGDASPSRATPIIFASPVTIAAGSSPKLFVTTDMLHSVQLKVDVGGTTLTPVAGNDPVALFGGLTRGTSQYYSNANTLGSYKVGSVQGYASLRLFSDQSGTPLFLMSPNTCGVEGPKGAWASPPVGATIGGWLGRDASRTLAWALPLTSSYTAYSAYFVMAEQTVIGQSTVLKCKAATSPPVPADGKTYASGAPAMASPDRSTALMLLAK